MTLYDETDRRWDLAARIGVGGEGEVFRLEGAPMHCAKVYLQRPVPETKVRKLEALRARAAGLQGVAALPLSLLYAKPGRKQAAGVVLPFVEGRDIHELYNPEARQEAFPGADLGFLVAVARNVAFVFGRVHAAGMVIGDVSEQNLKVRGDATVTLIDCDSVQLLDGTAFFPCEVGTPMWTPPELQARGLGGVRRSPNHDGFGLAQMIFLLLFGGRYPYAGVPAPGVDLSPEEAVARFAFAYDPRPAKPLLSPPPHAIRFSVYPEAIRELFLRAFRRGSEKDGSRPQPREWIAALTALGQGLRVCPASQAHHFPGEHPRFPWCEMAQRAGVDLFPTLTGGGVLSLWGPEAFKLENSGFRPVPESVLQPALAKARAAAGSRAGSGWMLKIGAVRRFINGGELADLRRDLVKLEKQMAQTQGQLRSLFQAHQIEVETAGRRASALAAVLRNPAVLQREVQAEVVCRLQADALEDFLRGVEIPPVGIKGIGRRRIEALLSNGIETAADVRPERLAGVHSFGPELTGRLMKWRRDVEAGFQFVGTQSQQRTIDAGVAAAMRKRTDQLKAQIRDLVGKADSSRRAFAKLFLSLEQTHHQQVIRREELQIRIEAMQ